MAVEIQVVVPASRVGVAHLALEVPRKDLADHGVLPVALEGPGVVLAGTQVDVLEFVGSFIVEERISEPGLAVLGSEEQTQRVFGVLRASAESAANSQAGVGLKPFAAIGMD